MCLHSYSNDSGSPPNWWWELGPQPFITLFWTIPLVLLLLVIAFAIWHILKQG